MLRMFNGGAVQTLVGPATVKHWVMDLYSAWSNPNIMPLWCNGWQVLLSVKRSWVRH